MIEPRVTELLFAPTKQYVEAHIGMLTPEMIDRQVMREWWSDPDLIADFEHPPIDRHWDWRDAPIEFAGRILASHKMAIVTGDGMVQGAMLVSSEPIPSVLATGGALFVERLFTAPRNRPELRADRQPHLLGVGTELLTWAAWLSRSEGCDGRLRLDGSPDFITWYRKRGLQEVDLEPIVFEGISYTPMELPGPAAHELLSLW